MIPQASGEQLEMNFDLPSGNRFRQCLDRGVFTVLFEHTAPDAALADEEAAARLALLERTALNFRKLPCALALTDRYWFEGSRRAVDYARLLDPAHRNAHLVYLSGRGSTPQDIDGLIAAARSANLANLVAVSGERRAGEGVRELRGIPFTESVNILRSLAAHPEHERFFIGGTVNPHCYAAPGLYAGLFKLVKKFQFGAEFAVTQAGFDLAQLDALHKYLALRGICQPLIARLMVLTPEKLEQITTGALPGITISDDMLMILSKELRFSASQFEAAQWRRLELQAAGCRLLGYSGIQLAGADTPDRMRIAAERIHQALLEYTSLPHWLEDFNSYLARTDRAPDDGKFYLFDHLLEAEGMDAVPKLHDFALPKAGAAAKLRDRMTRYFFPDADRQPPEERRWLKKLLAHCQGCGKCRLPLTQFCCVERCPKRLANGVCGGVKADGRCEAGNIPCVHLDIWLAAERRKECDALEANWICPGKQN